MAELSTLDMVGRLLLAAALGAAIGGEREMKGQDAGLRTHLMLSLGAALFGLISVGAWDDFFARTNDSNYRIDPTRVASYVAAGIGFLGGGAILKQAGGVRGLTTAASLWVVAAIGLAIGVGLWIPAVAATSIALVSLAALVPVRSVVRRAGKNRRGNLIVRVRDASAAPEIIRLLHEGMPATPAELQAGPAADGTGYEIVVSYVEADPVVLGQCASRLAGLEVVSGVHVGAT